jgi:hypothetical protein
VSLFFDGSETFRSSEQLIDLGLIRSNAGLDALAAYHANIERNRDPFDHAASTEPCGSDSTMSLSGMRETPAPKSRGLR